MLGAVFCGGNSNRMGTDKGLILWRGISWAQLAAEKLKQLNIPVVISLNRNQQKNYAEQLAGYLLVEDDESLAIGGPLKGLISVHNRFPGEDLLVLACDMPMMNIKILRILIEAWDASTGMDVCLFTIAGEPEPLCAVYAETALAKLSQFYLAGALSNFSMRHFLDKLTVHKIEVPEKDSYAFRNLNSPGELPDIPPA
jgi:molybdopterin-guanine dinucleotide biosynthesis protein A